MYVPSGAPPLILEAANKAWAVPHDGLWRMLLSGNRARIAQAVERINQAGQADDYAALLLVMRRRAVYRVWYAGQLRLLRLLYGERARRSAQSALGLLWGPLGRELATALDPKASHFDRAGAYKALVRRRDHRAVGPLIDALMADETPENWQCIAALGELGDLRAADALLAYMNLGEGQPNDSPIPAHRVDVGIEVGRALRGLNARSGLPRLQAALSSPDPSRRAAAALISGGWGEDRKFTDALIPALMALTGDTEVKVQRAALTALGELKALPALEIARAHLQDADSDLRAAAERAHQQILAAHPTRPRRYGTQAAKLTSAQAGTQTGTQAAAPKYSG